MWRDPIVDEGRQLREEYAAQFDFEIESIFQDLRERPKDSGRRVVVRLPPKQVKNSRIEANTTTT